MFELILALGALLGGGSYTAYRFSGISRAGRRARGLVKRVGREQAATEGSLADGAELLQRDAGRFAAARHEQTRAATPIEKLKDLGARKVRWGLLQDAGFRSLADLKGASTRGLIAVKGIGPISARRIGKAARLMDRRIAQQAVSAPEPDLAQGQAEPLVKSALDQLDARRELLPLVRRLRREHTELAQRARGVRRESSLSQWLLDVAKRADQGPKIARAEQLAVEAQSVLDELAEAAATGREQAARRRRTPSPGRSTLSARYREHHADLVSLMAAFLAPADLPTVDIDPSVGARLPEEIVARVRALELQVDDLDVVLRRYQEFGARFLLVQERTLLGDDMGLGKTIQALAGMVHLAATGEGSRFLVVAPATVVPSWAREIDSRTPLACHVLRGSLREQALARWLAEGGVAVTSYSSLRLMDVDELLPSRIDLLIADEAHFLKNPEASRTQAVAELLPMSRRVCLMTGTPIENRLEDFQRLVHLARPGFGGAAGWGEDAGLMDPATFRQQVAGVYLRRNQSDVLHELPERLEKVEWVDLDDDEQRAYREAVASGNIMAMRRAATIGDWRASKRRTDANGRRGAAADPGMPRSAKLGRLVDLVEEHAAAGRKVLIFSFFRDVLAAMEQRLDVIGTIQGDVSAEDREVLMQRFRDHDGHAVLLGQITAAGVGLNLQAASVVVLTEPQWKPSTEAQAIARAHRMGQSERVVVHRLLARDSVDERIMELLIGKRELFERYARQSALAAASPEATEAQLSRLVVEAERARLDVVPAEQSDADAPPDTAPPDTAPPDTARPDAGPFPAVGNP